MSGKSGLPQASGQCASCVHARSIPHPRGTEAYCMCGLAESDPQYDKYPRLPVQNCPGYRQREPD